MIASPDATWSQATAGLVGARVRPEILIEEVPAPSRLAPYAMALAIDVVSGDDSELGSGKFVVLHDPAGQPTWRGQFRVVTFIRAQVEPEMVADEMAEEVAWSWLTEVLSDVAHHSISGTVTRTISRSFAELEDREADTELEIRASWTPELPAIAPHLHAWLSLVEMCAGLVPLPAGLTAIGRHI